MVKGWVKELWQVYLSEFFLAFYFPKAVFILFFLVKGLSLAEIGFATSAVYAANLFLEYPSGVFADRFGRKLSLQLSSLGAAASALLYAFGPGFKAVVAASIIWGASWSFYSGAKEALIYDGLKSKGKESLNKDVLGLLDALGFAGMIIATYAGHILYGLKPHYPFLASAAAYISASLALSTYKEEKPLEEDSPRREDFKKGVRLVFQNETLRYLLLLAVTLFFFEHAWHETNQPLLLKAGLPSYLLSTYFVASSVLGVLAGLLFPSLVAKAKAFPSIALVMLMQSLALFFISTGNAWLLVPFSYLMPLSHYLWSYAEAEVIHKHIPSKVRASVLSAKQLVTSSAYLFNPWLMAYLVQKYSFPVFSAFSVIVVAVSLPLLLQGKHCLEA